MALALAYKKVLALNETEYLALASEFPNRSVRMTILMLIQASRSATTKLKRRNKC